MGMFTVVTDEAGDRWQFKTGFDDLEEFKVGDDVTKFRRVSESYPGTQHLSDGVYDAIHEHPHGVKAKPDHWVVISEGRILPLIPIQRDREDDYWFVWREHTLEYPPVELWSDKAWAEKAKRDHEAAKRKDNFNARTAGMSPTERAGVAMSDITRAYLQEEGFTRKILPPEPVDA